MNGNLMQFAKENPHKMVAILRAAYSITNKHPDTDFGVIWDEVSDLCEAMGDLPEDIYLTLRQEAGE